MKIISTLLLVLFFIFSSYGQGTGAINMNLQEVIDQAQGKTPRAATASTILNRQYWNYTAFQGSFKPSLTAEATLPDYNRSIVRITQPDGTEAFRSRSQLSTSGGLRISQIIPQLGSRVFLYSGLERLDLFDQNGETVTSYFSTPVSIGFSQPLFQHNAYKWNQKIEPLNYEIAQKSYDENMEAIAYDAVQSFFDYYIAQLNLEASRLDKQNADSLFVIAQGRYSVGKIAETDLLQIELNAKTTDAQVAQAGISLENSAENLRTLLNIRNEVYFQLAEPAPLPALEIDVDKAIAYAKLNKSATVDFRRRLLQAERDVDQAQKNNGLQLDLTGSFGLSQTAGNLDGSYKDLLDQERIALRLQIPIADWGRSKAQQEIAYSEHELVKIQVAQAEDELVRTIKIKVRQLNLLRNQLDLETSSYTVAQKKLEINQKRYYIGKIGVQELNRAIIDQESSRQRYFRAIQNYYLAYYEIRGLTLYDFVTNVEIKYNN